MVIAESSVTLAEGILRALRHGRQNAITGKELASRLGERDDRRVRLVIRDLIAAGHPIASAVNKPYGYFIANSPDEVTEYMNVLRSRLVEDAYRRRDFKRATKALTNPGQLSLL